jgi:hypothetical protein
MWSGIASSEYLLVMTDGGESDDVFVMFFRYTEYYVWLSATDSVFASHVMKL